MFGRFLKTERLDNAISITQEIKADAARLIQQHSEAKAEIARLQAEVAAAETRGFNAGIEEAAHLIECDGDAMKGKADVAHSIRALKRPTSEVSNG